MNGGPSSATTRVRGPAIGLIAMGALGLTANLGSVLFALVMPSAMVQQASAPELEFISSPLFLIASTALGVAIALVQCLAGLQMLRLKSYGLAMVGSILSILPCACCCLSMPFGIWALVVLLEPEVKQAFR